MSVAKCANAASTYKVCIFSLYYYFILDLQLSRTPGTCLIRHQQTSAGQRWLYLDAGHSGWLGWPANITPAAQLFAEVLQGAGTGATVRGLATDVSNYNLLRGAEDPAQSPNPITTRSCTLMRSLPYYNRTTSRRSLSSTRAAPVYLESAQREGDWCNVLGTAMGFSSILEFAESSAGYAGAGLGMRPTTDTGNNLIDSIVWVKPPGSQTGTSNTTHHALILVSPRFHRDR